MTAGHREEGIDRAALGELKKQLLAFAHVDDINLEGLSESRKSVVTRVSRSRWASLTGCRFPDAHLNRGAQEA